MSDPIEVMMNADGSFDLPSIHVVPYVAPVAVDPVPVSPPPPPATIPVAAFGVTVKADRIVVVQDQSTNVPAGSTAKVQWDSTHGVGIRIGNTASYQYTTGGIQTITETVTAPDGTTYTATRQVDVDTPTVPTSGSTTPASPSPPPPVSTLPPPPTLGAGVTADSVTLTGTLANGATINVTAQKGQRVPLVAGSIGSGSLVFHADGLSACIENCYMGLTGDLSGTFRLVAGDTVLFDGPLTIWAYARTRPFWLRDPQPLASPRVDLLPNLGAGSENASQYASYIASSRGPMDAGPVCTAMDNTGERLDLGQINGWSACAVTNPTAENLAVVRGISDGAAVWACHVIDPATNDLVDIRANPWITMLNAFRGATHQGATNPIVPFTSATPLKMGTGPSHAPQYVSPACAFYATDYDAEELAFWANYMGGLWQNPVYRLAAGCTTPAHEQTRGKGRMLDMLAYASQMSSKPDWFMGWLQALAVGYNNYLSPLTGIHVDQPVDATSGYPQNGFAPWQENIEVAGFGHCLDVGVAGFQFALDWYAETLCAAILDAQHEFATKYTLSWKYPDGTIAKDWPDALNATAAYGEPMASAIQCAEDSQALQTALGNTTGYQPGDFSGYPWAPDGYPAMAQPGYAAIANHATDQVRAQAAWTKFSKYRRCDYSANPKYNVVPRAA